MDRHLFDCRVNMSHTPARNDPYQLFTDTILAHLESGTVPWRCPWNRSTGRPQNFHTGCEYQGVNVLLLGLLHFPSPWWMTFRQAHERGGSVRKGERGAVVVKWGRHQRAVNNGDGVEDKKTMFFFKSYHVFNATQIEGIEFPSAQSGPQLDPTQRIARAEQIVAQMPQQPTISEGRTTQACYRRWLPNQDSMRIFEDIIPESHGILRLRCARLSASAPLRMTSRGVVFSSDC